MTVVNICTIVLGLFFTMIKDDTRRLKRRTVLRVPRFLYATSERIDCLAVTLTFDNANRVLDLTS